MKKKAIKATGVESVTSRLGNANPKPPVDLNERETRLILAITGLVPDLRWVMENSRPVNLQTLRSLLGLERLAFLSMGLSALVPDEFWVDLAGRDGSDQRQRTRGSKANRRGGGQSRKGKAKKGGDDSQNIPHLKKE